MNQEEIARKFFTTLEAKDKTVFSMIADVGLPTKLAILNKNFGTSFGMEDEVSVAMEQWSGMLDASTYVPFDQRKDQKTDESK